MSIQPVFLMSDIFPFSAILDFLRDILMQAWLCLAVVLRPIVGDTIVDAFPFIMGGTLVTVGSVALALGMGLVLGVPMAVLQVYGNALARRLVGLDALGFSAASPSWCCSSFPRGFSFPWAGFSSPSCSALPRHGLHQHGLSVPDLPGRHREPAPGTAQGRTRPGHARPDRHHLHHPAAGPAPFHPGLGQRIFHPPRRLRRLLPAGHHGDHGPRQCRGPAYA